MDKVQHNFDVTFYVHSHGFLRLITGRILPLEVMNLKILILFSCLEHNCDPLKISESSFSVTVNEPSRICLVVSRKFPNLDLFSFCNSTHVSQKSYILATYVMTVRLWKPLLLINDHKNFI